MSVHGSAIRRDGTEGVTAVFRESKDFSQEFSSPADLRPCYDSASRETGTGMAPPHVVDEFGEFHFDRNERVLRRGSLTVPLTPKATTRSADQSPHPQPW